MKKYIKLILLLTLVLIVAACSSNNNSKNTDKDKMKISVVYAVNDDHLVGIGANKFKERVEEELGDKFQVNLHPNASLFDIDDGTEALQSGNVQMVLGSMSKLVGFDPAYQIYDLPFLFDSTEHVRAFNNSEEGQELFERIESSNLKILETWPGAFSQFTNSKREIREPKDMEGLKFRIMAGGLLADQFKYLGSGATVIPFSDLYMSLQQGVVDGQENPFLEIFTNNIHEVQDYLTVSNHKLSTYPVLTNVDFWNDLEDEDREALENILEEVTEEVDELSVEMDNDVYEQIKESGDIEIVELTDEERKLFEDALEPLYEEYSDIIGEDLINKAQDLK